MIASGAISDLMKLADEWNGWRSFLGHSESLGNRPVAFLTRTEFYQRSVVTAERSRNKFYRSCRALAFISIGSGREPLADKRRKGIELFITPGFLRFSFAYGFRNRDGIMRICVAVRVYYSSIRIRRRVADRNTWHFYANIVSPDDSLEPVRPVEVRNTHVQTHMYVRFVLRAFRNMRC